MTPAPMITVFGRNEETVSDAVMWTPFAGQARPGSVGLISAATAAQNQLRGRPAPQPPDNFGSRLCGCKDFVASGCVVDQRGEGCRSAHTKKC